MEKMHELLVKTIKPFNALSAWLIIIVLTWNIDLRGDAIGAFFVALLIAILVAFMACGVIALQISIKDELVTANKHLKKLSEEK